ncbi:MAG: serine/threonine protein kinase [Clostridia bacterium]|nr:serine/threonine protein kinase [Clostridia bacterium]
MTTLKTGDTVKMKGGGFAKVLAEFGSGGQGAVYKASYNGKEYALKWYHPGAFHGKEDAFYANLEYNIAKGAPADAFLWPLAITEKLNGSFGYLMAIRPDGYEELTNFFVSSQKKQQVHFKSFSAITTAAINMINALWQLHKRGDSYRDINNGTFFIDPVTGRVLICDNVNVSPYGSNPGIMGKSRWMAPEIVTRQSEPDKQSDQFSLAVVLFRLLFLHHPLEGSYSSPPCMTREKEIQYYGTDPVFIFDPADPRNRPVPGTDHNLKLFWGLYPEYVRQTFCRAFSREVMLRKEPRVSEQEWLDVFFRLRAETGLCPHCHREMFYTAGGASRCFECGGSVAKTAGLAFAACTLPLHSGMKLYLRNVDSGTEDIESLVAEVVASRKDPGGPGLRNLSASPWMITLPGGARRPLEPGKAVPVRNGYVIDFMNAEHTLATMEL